MNFAEHTQTNENAQQPSYLIIPHPKRNERPNQQKIIGKYEIHKNTIGSGKFCKNKIFLAWAIFLKLGSWGKVKTGRNLETNQIVAVKIYRKRQLIRKMRDGLDKLKQ